MRLPFIIILAFFFCSILKAQQPELVLPVGHNFRVIGARFSNDARFTVTSSTDGTAKVWETNSGKLISTIRDKKMNIGPARFSMDNKYVITVSENTTAVWEPVAAKLIKKIKGTIADIDSRVITDDGKNLATVSGKTVNICEIPGGKIIRSFRSPAMDFYSACFSSDEKYLVTVSIDQKAAIWEISSGRPVGALQDYDHDKYNMQPLCISGENIAGHYGKTTKLWSIPSGKLIRNFQSANTVNHIDLSADNKLLSISTSDGITQLWDIGDEKKVNEFKGYENGNGALFSPTGEYIGLYANDGSLVIREPINGRVVAELHDLVPGGNSIHYSKDGKYMAVSSGLRAGVYVTNGGKEISELRGHESETRYAEYSPDGKYIVIASSLTAKVWETSTGKLLHNLEGHTDEVRTAVFSPDGKYIVTTSKDRTARVWETQSGKQLSLLEGHTSYVNAGRFSQDGKYVVTSSDDKTAKVWEWEREKCVGDLVGHSAWVVMASFSPDGKYVVTASWDNTARVWERTGKPIAVLKGHADFINMALFSPDNKQVITVADDHEIKFWNINDNKAVRTIHGHSDDVVSLGFSSNGKLFITSSWDKTAKIWETATGKRLNTLIGHRGYVNAAEFSSNGKFVVTASRDNTAKIWDVVTGKLIHDLQGHTGEVNSAKFSHDDKFVVTASLDNTCKVWETNTGKLLYTFLILDNKEYFTWLNSEKGIGYYSGKKEAIRFLSFHIGKINYSFDQFDLQYNRPDKVLEALGNKDTAWISLLRNAYQKRMQRLSISTVLTSGVLSFPIADFANRDTIKYDYKAGNLKLHIKGSDNSFQLDRFNVWVNEVPEYGSKGFSIRDQYKRSVDTVISINLLQGENRVETSVFNVNATESYRSPLFVNYTPASPLKDTLYYIGIGVNQHKNDPSRNLSFAAKDIRDLDSLFRKNNTTVVSKIFIDSSSTKENILSVKKMLMNTGINDKVIIALSGHGVLHEQKDFYFGTYDIDFNKPNERGLKYEDLESLLDDIPARKKLLLIDACHSGEVDTSLVSIASETKETDTLPNTIKTKGDPNRRSRNAIGLDNSFELMKELFTDLSRGNGAVVISAARGLGYAEEDPTWNNGAFTICLKAAFSGNPDFPELKEGADKNGDGVSINELKEYILTKVPLLTKKRQKPTTRRENIEVDWKLW